MAKGQLRSGREKKKPKKEKPKPQPGGRAPSSAQQTWSPAAGGKDKKGS